MSKIVGIDLGSSNSCVAWWDGRAPQILTMRDEKSRTIPSAVAINLDKDVADDDRILIGQDAIDYGRAHPADCFRLFKRKLGEKWHDDEDSGYQTVEGEDGNVWLKASDGQAYSPEMLCACIIDELLAAAAIQLGERPTGAVICCPADFTEAQRCAVERAGKLAGLTTVILMAEPTAAALAFGVDAKKVRRVAVFDLGGSSLDVSIIQAGKGLIEVKTTNGLRKLGGADWDDRIADFVVSDWRKTYGTDLGASDAAMRLIRDEAEQVKIRLSGKSETVFRRDDLDKAPSGEDLHARLTITQAMLNDLTADLRASTIKVCQRAIDDVKRADPNFDKSDIHDVILVGGMTRIPAVRDDVAAFFGKPAQRSVNPEEVVAMGAAIHAAIYEGRKTDTTIMDVTSHALAIEAVGDVAAMLLPKGTVYPMKEPVTVTLTNTRDDQGAISIRLVQGDGARPSVCEMLAAVDVEIDPIPRRTARLKLYATLDDSGRPSVWSDDGPVYP